MKQAIDFLIFLTVAPFAVFGLIVGLVLIRAAWLELNHETKEEE